MCYHEQPRSTKFSVLAAAMKAKFGLVAVSYQHLWRGSEPATMFVNPRVPECVNRARVDLENWHKGYDIRNDSLNQLELNGYNSYQQREALNLLRKSRRVPHSVEITDAMSHQEIYDLMKSNGYVTI